MPDPAAILLLTLFLVPLALWDLRHHRLPDRLTLPLIGAGLLDSAFARGGLPLDSGIGAAVGFLVFWAIGEAHFRLRQEEGLGLGDAKLFAAGGAWLGWAALPWVLLIASGGALAFTLARRRGGGGRIAFGPWLALGILAVWIARHAGV